MLNEKSGPGLIDFKRKNKHFHTEKLKFDGNRIKKINQEKKISWTVDMNVQINELMMSLPHKFALTKIWWKSHISAMRKWNLHVLFPLWIYAKEWKIKCFKISLIKYMGKKVVINIINSLIYIFIIDCSRNILLKITFHYFISSLFCLSNFTQMFTFIRNCLFWLLTLLKPGLYLAFNII